MKKKGWLIWILLIVVVILFFPKSCGNRLPSEVLEYTCLGFQTPLLSSLDKSENPIEWCSGVCTSKNIKPAEIINTTQDQSGIPAPVVGIIDSVVKVIPALVIIFGMIIFASWLKSATSKGKTEIRIVKGSK